MALSGSFYQYPVSQFGLYCEWSGIPNTRTNSTRITVDVYLRYYNITTGQIDGSISIDGASEMFTTPTISDANANTWTNILLGSFTKDVSHEADGSKTGLVLSASLAYHNTYDGEDIGDIVATTTVDLNTIAVYKLYKTAGANSSIVVNRIYSSAGTTGELADMATLYDGDRLKITFFVSDGYQIVAHTVNGFAFASGGSIIVDGNIIVVSSAQEIIRQSFTPENMQCFDTKGRPLKTLWQWDKDVSVVIKDMAISPPPVFQFANRMSRETISVASTVSGEDLIVEIPNVLLEKPDSVFAYIHRNSGNGITRTLGSIYIPVRARKQPDDN